MSEPKPNPLDRNLLLRPVGEWTDREALDFWNRMSSHWELADRARALTSPELKSAIIESSVYGQVVINSWEEAILNEALDRLSPENT